MNMATTKTASHRYSLRRKAIAPSRMASEISRIRSFPLGAASTWRVNRIANTSAARPKTRAAIKKND